MRMQAATLERARTRLKPELGQRRVLAAGKAVVGVGLRPALPEQLLQRELDALYSGGGGGDSRAGGRWMRGLCDVWW